MKNDRHGSWNECSLKAHLFLCLLLAVIPWTVVPIAAQTSPTAADRWKAVSDAIGRPGRALPDGPFTVPLPRGDLDVRVGDLKLAPVLWMASSVTFSTPGDDSIVMGDVLLTDTEVASTMSRLTKTSIVISALHTHLIRETPRLMFMHIESHGNAVKIAQELRQALSEIKMVTPTAPQVPADFDLASIETILGQKGRIAGGGAVFNVARAEAVTMSGMKVPASMASTSILLFQPLGKGKVAVTGDLVLLASEVDPVLRVLVEHGIEITTIHNHMLTESPRLFFLHYWASGDQTTIAQGLRKALDITIK